MRKYGVVGLLALTVALSACGSTTQDSSSTLKPQAAASAPFVQGEILVQFTPRAGERGRAEVERMGLRAVERVASTNGAPLLRMSISNGQSVSAAIQALSRNPNVAFAEPNWIYTHDATSDDPLYTNGSLWGMYGDASTPANQYGSQAAEAWAAGRTGSKTVFIGVIDEGIDYNHEDLAANIWTNPYDPADGVDNDGNGYVDDIRGWDFDGNDNSIYDPKNSRDKDTDSHGTHVAGTIGGLGGNAKGVAGVNWNVTMISGKFLGSRGGTTANAIKAVDYFTDLKTRHGLNIVATSNSWGGGGFSQGLLDAINRGGNAGILFIAAAGNGGNDGVGDNNDTTTNYPSNYECTANGTYDCVIAVAAIQSDGNLASFSNYGAKTVDLGAPGRGVYSTTPRNTYSSYSGTSMATPHVSGAAALYAASNTTASAQQIKEAIMAATAATASLNGKTVSGGRLNAGGF